jgi:hypothetical protein
MLSCAISKYGLTSSQVGPSLVHDGSPTPDQEGPDQSPCPLRVISGHQRANSGCPLYPSKADMLSIVIDVRFVPTADIDLWAVQATRVNERLVFGWVPVEASVLAACIPSSSSDRTAAERLMPPRLAHALIDTKREAGSRTVMSGSPPLAALALFVGFGGLMILEITASRTCMAIHDTRGGVITLAPGHNARRVILSDMSA